MREVIGKLTMSIMLPTTTRRGFATHAHADTALHCNSVFDGMRRMVTTASTVTRRASNTVNREASGRERNRVVSRAKSKVKSKTKEVYLCNECGEDFSQWHGKCPSCKTWGSLSVMKIYDDNMASTPRRGGGGGGGGARAAERFAAAASISPFTQDGLMPSTTTDFRETKASASSLPTSRMRGTWIAGVDRSDVGMSLSRVLSECDDNNGLTSTTKLPGSFGEELCRVIGGLVKGSLVLVGGDPGVGKSTLMMQVATLVAGRDFQPSDTASQSDDDDDDDDDDCKVLYVSGEESAAQIAMRARRLSDAEASNSYTDTKNNYKLSQNHFETLYVQSATRLDDVLESVVRTKPSLVIIDSIQTLYLEDVAGSAGSISQVKECTTALLQIAKKYGITVFIIGHVTKTGDIAGPRVLEHIVDTVLYLEGDRHGQYRILRSLKNRFGATDEIGVFIMRKHGLEAVVEISSLFMSSDSYAFGAYSTVTAVMEGSRPVLVEIQALVSNSSPHEVNEVDKHQIDRSSSYVTRSYTGVDRKRMQMLLAIAAHALRMNFSTSDLFVNVTGGFEIKDTSTDLAIIGSVVAAKLNRRVRKGTLLIGEIGLGGELRPASLLDRRLSEAARYGFRRVIVPGSQLRQDGDFASTPAIKRMPGLDIDIVECRTMRQALSCALETKEEAEEEERKRAALENTL